MHDVQFRLAVLRAARRTGGQLSGLLVVLVLCAGCSPSRPSLPAKGAVFADSLYGSMVVRISDKDVDGYSGSGIQNEYARADAWNSSGTRLILRSNDGNFYLYDGSNFALLRNLSSEISGQEPEPRWLRDDPNRFYFLNGPCLMRYDIAGQARDTIHDFTREFPGCGYVTTGTEGDADRDRRFWALMVTDSAFNLQAVCVYDREIDLVVGTRTTFPDAVNHVTMDVTGRHAVIAYDSRPMEAFHPDFSHAVTLAPGAMGHSDVALTRDSVDVMVYQNVATDFIAMSDLETGVETPLLAIPFDTNPDIGLHVSGNCDLAPGWVLISTYGAKNPPSGRGHSWMDNLLFMLELRPDPRVVKLAATHCYTGDEPQSNYFAEAFASINRAGAKVVYGSNWGRLSPAEYSDAYEVRLPADWNRQ